MPRPTYVPQADCDLYVTLYCTYVYILTRHQYQLTMNKLLKNSVTYSFSVGLLVIWWTFLRDGRRGHEN